MAQTLHAEEEVSPLQSPASLSNILWDLVPASRK
jgi:hypothetical protein